MIETSPGFGESINGVVLYDETIRQHRKYCTPLINSIIAADIIPGIEVDTGAKNMAGHSGDKVSEGLNVLRERLNEYLKMGARFANRCAVIALGEGIPSLCCIDDSSRALARYAALCQEAGLVPIIEPEVLMEGKHTLAQSFEVTDEILRMIFNQRCSQRVTLEGMILNTNMVIQGLPCPK